MKKQVKKDYFGILGVTAETPLDEVKRIYRRKARGCHPDKFPGDKEKEEEFKELSEAYEIVMDPGKRSLYESTGYAERTPVEKEVESVFLQGFQDALNKDAPNILRHLKTFIDGGKQQLLVQKNEIIQDQKKLQKKRKKVKVKKKGLVNLFELVIDQQLKNLEQTLNTVDYKLQVAAAAYELLKHYEEEQDPPPGYGIVTYDPRSPGGSPFTFDLEQIIRNSLNNPPKGYKRNIIKYPEEED